MGLGIGYGEWEAVWTGGTEDGEQGRENEVVDGNDKGRARRMVLLCPAGKVGYEIRLEV